jgi:hypothetical protein
MEPTKNDTTVEEIHQIRREISDRFDGDVFAIAEDAARRQLNSGRPVWCPKTTIIPLQQINKPDVSQTDTSTPTAG